MSARPKTSEKGLAQLVRIRSLDDVLAKLEGVRRSSTGHVALCPAHDDSNPSLQITVGRGGALYLKCRAGCSEVDVARALDLEPGQRVTGSPKAKPKRAPAPPLTTEQVEHWHAALLRDEGAMQHVTKGLRFSLAVVKQLKLGLTGDGIAARRLAYPYADGSGGWSHANCRALDGQEPRYKCQPAGQQPRLFNSGALRPDGVAIVLEGERDVAAALSARLDRLPGAPVPVGLPGAGQVRGLASQLAAQKLVILCTDADKPGDRAAEELARELGPERCRRVRLEGAKDFGDMLAALGPKKARSEFCRLLKEAENAAPLDVTPKFELTDVGNAERFAAQHSGTARFVHGGWQRWHLWCGTHWAHDEVGEATQLATRTAKGIFLEAASEGGNGGPHGKWALRSQSRERLRAMLDLAKDQPTLRALPRDFDRQGELLNVRNGTLNLRTGELHPHSATQLITRLVDVDYSPKATAPRFMKFIERILPDRELRDFVKRALGYSATGSVGEQVLFFAFGDGSNGKSVLLKTVNDLLSGYAQTAAPELLMTQQHSAHPEEIAELQGARMVLTSEVPKGSSWNEARVKALTGGDRISARRMYQSRESFDPTFKIWVLANPKPHVRGTDHAIWRRFMLIPFEQKIEGSEVDTQLAQKLRAEWQGILTWLVEGAREWHQGGLQAPRAVREALNEYRSSEDTVAQFLEECCERVASGRVSLSDAFARYCQWTSANNFRQGTSRDLAERLRTLGFGQKRLKQGNAFTGLKLLPPRGFEP